MFERFTAGGRRVVELAQMKARDLGHNWVGTEHLILALVAEDFGAATEVLRESGVGERSFRKSLEAELGAAHDDWARDAEALRSIGIDFEEVRKRVEETFGPGALGTPQRSCKRRARFGHIPFTRKSKRVLVVSLREALRMGQRSIGAEHILLGVLRDRSALGARLVEELGGSPDELRDRLLSQPRRAS